MIGDVNALRVDDRIGKVVDDTSLSDVRDTFRKFRLQLIASRERRLAGHYHLPAAQRRAVVHLANVGNTNGNRLILQRNLRLCRRQNIALRYVFSRFVADNDAFQDGTHAHRLRTQAHIFVRDRLHVVARDQVAHARRGCTVRHRCLCHGHLYRFRLDAKGLFRPVMRRIESTERYGTDLILSREKGIVVRPFPRRGIVILIRNGVHKRRSVVRHLFAIDRLVDALLRAIYNPVCREKNGSDSQNHP